MEADLQPPDLTLATAEREHILRVLALNNWHIGKTAGALGVATKSVYNALHRYQQQGHVIRTPAGWRLAPPLPIALQATEITDADVETMLRAARAMTAAKAEGNS